MSQRRTVKTAAGSRPLRYVAIDATGAKDSAVFGATLESLYPGWHNLLKDERGGDRLRRIQPNNSVELARFEDPAHPFLPIYGFLEGGREVPVICPGGVNGHGIDEFWLRWKDRLDWGKEVYRDRHAAALQANQFVRTFLRAPRLVAPAPGHYALADESATTGDPDLAADLLYVSSHGWLGGFMAGESMWTLRDSVAPYCRVREGRFFGNFFMVGRLAKLGLGFHGPRWIILAQCSTLNEATWPLWTRVLAKSSPHVRGILAYEGSAPGIELSAALNREFLAEAKRAPLLTAWERVNSKRKRLWSAVVHKDAVGDRLGQFGRYPELRDVSTTGDHGSYVGFRSDRAGTVSRTILDKAPPFQVEIKLGSYVVAADNLDSTDSALRNNCTFTFRVAAPDGAKLKRARLTLVRIRPDYTPQVSWARLFPSNIEVLGAQLSGANTPHLAIELDRDLERSDQLVFARTGELKAARLVAHHEYFWIRASIQLTSGKTLAHDFKTGGVRY